MAEQARDHAKAVVADIREQNGGISAEIRAVTPDVVLRSIAILRRKLAASTEVLAKNLYSKNTRFVYELVQNAEDNQYTKVNGANPFLSFTVYPDKILIDSNEDGFTEANVRAICSTGESTKANIAGYVGEKGIGFKSVFKVAKLVHIQSEPYSFAFEHTREADEDGLGMVTPWDAPFEVLPEDVRTRITLTLKDSPMTEQQCTELFDLPNTFLMFLKKLRTIRVKRCLSGPMHSTTYQYSFDVSRHIAAVTAVVLGGSTPTEEGMTKNFFRVVEHEVRDLPSDEARLNRNHATVVLAFPITAERDPVIAPQYVFAFLPLRRVGFPFLIQADFITQASREDIFDSQWNRHLLTGVALTFCKAVYQMCEDPKLVYDWVKYLPDDTIVDGFWRKLRPMIVDILQSKNVLRSRTRRSFGAPKNLRTLPTLCTDKIGEPLFRDIEGQEIYLSSRYDAADMGKLYTLGVKNADWTTVVKRVEADLHRADSTMKLSTDEDWHTRAATLLSVPFDTSVTATIQIAIPISNHDIGEVKRCIPNLPLIPLQNESWVAPTSEKIYFPKTGTSIVPHDLGFALVQESAVRNLARSQLFRHLGVEMCSPEDVMRRIYRRYRSSTVTLEEHKSHLNYLFLNLPETPKSLRNNLWTFSRNGTHVVLSGVPSLYFEETNEPYGPGRLFGDAANGQQPPVEVHFIHAEVATYPNDTIKHGRTYEQWLEQVVGVKRVPILVNTNGDGLSNEFKYIIEHSPELLVGVLKRYWSTYRPLILARETNQVHNQVEEALRDSRIPIEASGKKETLSSVYLPLPRLKKIASEVGVGNDNYPFLALPLELLDEDSGDWDFLNELGVGIRDDMLFYLELLTRLSLGSHVSIPSEKVIPLYSKLADSCATAADRLYLHACFREERGLIHVPATDRSSWFTVAWFHPDGCIWSGPEWLTCKRRLSPYHGSSEYFFRATLGIPDFKWQHCIEEIERIKASSRERRFERACEVYRWLMNEFRQHNNWEQLRSEFEQKELILIPTQNLWTPSSSCIWAESLIHIAHMHSIATVYADLSEFFTKMLGIERPNIRMHVQTLKDLGAAKGWPSAWWDQVKDTMMLISSMDPSPEDALHIRQQLRSANIFPVRLPSGLVRPTTSQVEFAIVDRPEYDGAFPNIKTLSIGLDRLHKYRKFFLAIGLQSKYLSSLVEERTEVDGGVLNSSLTAFLNVRAQALYRCAVHYNSPKTQDGDLTLFTKLQQAETFTSEHITKSVQLMQDGVIHKVEQQKARFHIDDSGETLRLYVPRDRKERQVCYFRQLPKRLLQLLAISDLAAEAIVGSIVNSSRLSIVDEILKDEGIPGVPGLGSAPVDDSEDDAASDDEVLNIGGLHISPREPEASGSVSGGGASDSVHPTPPESVRTATLFTFGASSRGAPDPGRPMSNSAGGLQFGNTTTSTRGSLFSRGDTSTPQQRQASPFGQAFTFGQPSSLGRSTANDGGDRFSNRDQPRPASTGLFGSSDPQHTASGLFSSGNSSFGGPNANAGAFLFGNNQTSSSGASLSPLFNNEPYAKLLDRVIKAGQIATLPAKGASSFANGGAITQVSPFGIFTTKLDRDRKVGAAGELFVFELLSALGLPNFGHENWRSTIRKEVKVHKKYKDLAAWNGSETADIVYRDTEDKLAKLLLQPEQAPDAFRQATFFVEVKTTTGPCNEAFFVSKSQYERMHRLKEPAVERFDDPVAWREIYVIMRVFHLEQNEIGLRVYVDPVGAKKWGELIFVEDTWKVIPTR